MTNTPAPAPKDQARILLAEYAAKKALLAEAIAPYLSQIAETNAAIAKATTAHQAELEAMEQQLKALALDHEKEIFGDDTRSLIEAGFILQLRSSTAIACEDEHAAIAELARLAVAAKGEEARLAAQACIRTKHELDREMIAKMLPQSPDWFAAYGISLVTKDSATVKPRPASKPKTAKRTAKPKQQAESATTEQPLIQEAA